MKRTKESAEYNDKNDTKQTKNSKTVYKISTYFELYFHHQRSRNGPNVLSSSDALVM